MHALIVSRGDAKWTPEGHQVHGFAMYERALRKSLGMTFETVATETLADVDEAILDRPADIVFVMVSWKEDPDDVVELFRRLSEREDRPKLVFLDYFAPASSPYFGVLPFVDAYFKRQMLRDPSLYCHEYEGGNPFTEYVSKAMGIELDGWNFASVADPRQLDKFVHGWNLGVTPHYRHLLKLTAAMPLAWDRRPFSVNCRMGLSAEPRAKTEWYHHYRERWVDALAPLRLEYRCTGSQRIRLRYYLAEMILSKIGVSPFGWGEVCYRDYEVIASGALLIKPSMAHLKTSPNIYVEGKTYVAASWDASDVKEICRYYLAHPEEAKEIIHNGRAALADYFENDGFVADVRRVLRVAGLDPNGVMNPARRIPIMA
jgi:Glycosyl transferases group 1